jgi:hypothetical protein
MTSIRLGPVPAAAIDDLLAAACACIDQPLPWRALVDRDAIARTARAFKLDVSFALAVDGAASARFSINDKGEPERFRERLLAASELLGVPRWGLDAQLALSPPGEVQTTLGVKWGPQGGDPERVSVYFEELYRSPRGLPIREAAFAMASVPVPDVPPGLDLVSVCLDWSGGALLAVKDYWMITERDGGPSTALPGTLDAYRAPFRPHPVNHTRRFLVASRHAVGGRATGAKLLWMSEVHRNETLDWAWREVDRLKADLPPSGVARTLDDLRANWRHAPGTFLYPDLVSLNVGADGATEGVLVYVSVR